MKLYDSGSLMETISKRINNSLIRGWLYNIIAETPTIDAEPVKHGRWKGEGMGDYSCSLCTEIVSGNTYNYCPYCGARMDGVLNETNHH